VVKNCGRGLKYALVRYLLDEVFLVAAIQLLNEQAIADADVRS